MAKIQGGVEMLDQAEDVALGRGLRVPPAPPLMRDDEHLALGAAVLQGAAGAFAAVQLPGPAHVFEHGRAVHLLRKSSSSVSAVMARCSWVCSDRPSGGDASLPFSPDPFATRRPRSRRGARAPPSVAAAAQRLPLQPDRRKR